MSGSPAPDPPDGPGGLVVIVRNDPTEAARTLADNIGATLAIGGRAVEAALDALRNPDGAVQLGRLSAAMRRAEAVQERTRVSAAAHLSRTVNAELAIHPDTLRRAAHELLAVEAELERARRGRGPVDARAARRMRACGTGGLTVAGTTIGALVSMPVGAAIVFMGLMGGSTALMVGRRAAVATVPVLEAGEALARRRWEQLAGRGADPADVTAVIHRYDPQHQMIADLVDYHPAVRAADRAATVRRTAWVDAWRSHVGDTTPPPRSSLPSVGPAGEELLGADEHAPPVTPTTTLVVAAPYTDLSDDCARRLHGRLLGLAPALHVIVVLGPESSVDRIAAVDLTDPPSLVDLAGAEREAATRPGGSRPVTVHAGRRSDPLARAMATDRPGGAETTS